MNDSRSLVKAYIALFSGVVFMCFSAIFIKTSSAPGIVTAFYRMGIASLVLLTPFLISLWRAKQKPPVRGVVLAVMAGTCFGIDMSMWSTGIVASNATIPTVFANTAPVWVGLGSMMVFRERHKRGFWIGLIIAFTGIPLLLKNDFVSSNGVLWGAFLGLMAGIFYGTFLLISQPGRKLMSTLSFLFISSLTAALVLAFFAGIMNYRFTGYDRNTVIIFLIYALGVQVIGWFLVNYAQGHLPASIVAPTLLTQPLGTAFLAIIMLREHLSFWHISGGMVVLSGIYAVHYSVRKNRADKPPYRKTKT